jgi:hypothetical protein
VKTTGAAAPVAAPVLALAACGGSASTSAPLGPGREQLKAGAHVFDLAALDVHGQCLLVDAAYLPEATSQDRAELERVVDSIRFLA